MMLMSFVGNKAFSGAGVSVFYNAEGTITNCTFLYNAVDGAGGAVQTSSDARMSVMYSQFIGKEAALF